MAEPKIPPEALDEAGKLLSKLWTEATDTGTKQVLEDLIHERAGATEGLKAKVYGKNSVEVKKDIYNGVNQKAAIGSWPVHVANKEKVTGRRLDFLNNEDLIDDPGGRATQDEMRNISTREEPSGSRARAGTAHSVQETFRAVRGPRTTLQDINESKVWSNLMDDPAYPAIAAGVTGAGAALYSSNANASTQKPYLNEPDVAAPATDKSYLNEPDLPQTPAPQAPVVAPVAAAPEAPATPAEEKPNYLKDAITAFTPPGALAMAEKYAVDPALKYLQKNVGEPILNANIEGQKLVGIGNVVPGQEYITRAMGSLFAGNDQLEKFGGTVTGAKNIAELTSKVGELPAAIVAAGADTLGKAPLFLIQGPKSGVALLDHAAAGAIIGLADPDMTVGEGALGAVALHGVGKALKGAASLMGQGARKVLGVLDKTFVDNFADTASKFNLEFGAPKAELAGYGGEVGKVSEDLKLGPLGESRRVQNATGGLDSKAPSTPLGTLHDMVHNPELVKMVKGKVSDLGGSIQPLYGRVVLDEAEGLVARFDEPLKNNTFKRVEIPLKTNADFVRLRGLLDRDLDTTQFSVTPEADEVMTPEAKRALRTLGDLDNPSAIDAKDQTPYFLTQNGEKLELHEVKSTEGKIANLDQRGGLVAMDDENGVTRYGRAMTDEGGTHVGVSPFEPHEGIPTFGGVHPVENLRGRSAIPDDELRKVLENNVTPLNKHISSEPSYFSQFLKDGSTELHAGKVEDQSRIGRIRANNKTIRFSKVANSNVEGIGYGEPPEPPDVPEDMPPPPPPGPPPPPEAPMADRIKTMGAKMKFWTRVGRQLVGAHLRAPLDLAGYISDQQSVKNLAASWTGINAALEKRAGAGATQAFREDTMKLFKGDMSFSDFERKAENNQATKEAWIGIRDMMGDAVKQRDANQAWLAERGYVPDESWSQSEGDAVTSYATREYMAHFLKPGQWLDVVRRDEKTMKAAVAGYQQWAKKAGSELSDTEALSKIVDALGTEDPGSLLFANRSTSGSASPTGKLNYRKDLPDWYRALLGENRDGFLAMSRTLAAQDALIANFKVYEGVAANPAWAGPKKVIDNWKQFPDNKRLYGAMAGKWAAPEVYDSLYTIPNIKNEVNKWISIPLGIVKTNQVSLGSFRTFLNMTMDNLMGGVLSGGLDLTKPFEAASAIKYAANAMREISSLPVIGKANPLGTTEFAQFIRDARRIGVDAPGHIGASLSETQARLVKNAYAEIAGVKGDNSNLMMKFYELHQRAGATGSMVVDGIDRVQKLASWKILTDKFLEDGVSKEDAMRKAARRVFASYPMYDRVGLLTDKMRSSMLGVVSPYSTFAMERNRVLGQVLPRLIDSVSNGASEDLGLKFRLLKYAAVGAALYGANGAFRRGFGNVSDADVELAMNRRSGSGTDKFSPNTAQWVAPFKDGRGKTAVVDMTQWLGVLSYLQGDPRLAPIVRMAINVIKQPLSGGMLGAGIDSGMKQLGINSGMDARPPTPDGSIGSTIASVGDAALEGGAAPRGLMDLYNNVKKTGALGDIPPGRDTLTGTQAALKTFPGIPFEQGVTQQGKQQQFSKAKSDARAILFHAAMMKPTDAQRPLQAVYEWLNKQIGGDPEIEKMRKEAHKRIEELSNEISKTSKAQRAAKEGK